MIRPSNSINTVSVAPPMATTVLTERSIRVRGARILTCQPVSSMAWVWVNQASGMRFSGWGVCVG
ncbi:hypothetical protein D3C79_1116190 [compost metagenome]